MAPKVSSVFRIARPFDEFFAWWVRFLRPFHRMTPLEMSVAAMILSERYRFEREGERDPEAAVMTPANKLAMIDRLNITKRTFYTVCSSLRKRGFFKDGGINPKFIPEYDGSDRFSILVNFSFTDGAKKSD